MDGNSLTAGMAGEDEIAICEAQRPAQKDIPYLDLKVSSSIKLDDSGQGQC